MTDIEMYDRAWELIGRRTLDPEALSDEEELELSELIARLKRRAQDGITLISHSRHHTPPRPSQSSPPPRKSPPRQKAPSPAYALRWFLRGFGAASAALPAIFSLGWMLLDVLNWLARKWFLPKGLLLILLLCIFLGAVFLSYAKECADFLISLLNKLTQEDD